MDYKKGYILNILIISYRSNYFLTPSQKSYLYAFKKYSKAHCYYINLAAFSLPKYLEYVDFDCVIINWFFMDVRRFSRHKRIAEHRIRRLNNVNAIKIVMPQDECHNPKWISSFCNQYKINYLLSVADESQWNVLYKELNQEHTVIKRVLTGYVDDEAPQYPFSITKTIDIGFRTFYLPILGKFGKTKKELCDVFNEKNQEIGLNLDLSYNLKDMFNGDDWIKFLSKCRYVLGAESGSSVMDYDGTLFSSLNKYEIDKLDGNINLKALSPRIFEAAQLRICQILMEGEYNNIIKPNVHYIPVKADYSNIADILDKIDRGEYDTEFYTNNAYNDLILSEKYTYSSFVEYVESLIIADSNQNKLLYGLNNVFVYFGLLIVLLITVRNKLVLKFPLLLKSWNLFFH